MFIALGYCYLRCLWAGGRSPTDDMLRESLDLQKYSEAAPDRNLEIADRQYEYTMTPMMKTQEAEFRSV
jgi:hypothetical protein